MTDPLDAIFATLTERERELATGILTHYGTVAFRMKADGSVEIIPGWEMQSNGSASASDA